MKLGFLLLDYFPFGGLQRDCLGIAKLCASRGHEVTILTRIWTGERPAGLNVELLGRHGWTNAARGRAFLRQLEEVLPARAFDGVIGFNRLPGLDVYYGADPCFAAKVQQAKSWWHRHLPRVRHYLAQERALFAPGARTELLLLTERDRTQYRECYGTEPERLHLLPPNATRRSFTTTEQAATRKRLRAEHGWAADAPLLLFVGSDFQRKGLDRALTAFATVAAPEAQLVVIGNREPGKFARLARQLGVAARVHFLGGRHDVPDWMLAADVLIHPARVETAGLVLLEAITSGLPVLVSAACGYAPFVAKAGGTMLPEPFDQSLCHRALAQLLEPATNRTARARALDFAAREDLYSCHERVADVLETTVRRKLAGKTAG